MSFETETEAKVKNCSCSKAMVVAIAALIFSIGALGLSIFGIVNKGGDIVIGAPKKVVISTQYDKGKSYEKALETKKPMIVFFYTDWCGFCQRFAPTFHKITKNKDVKKNFAIAYVNCENPDNRALMEEFKIEGFPSVFVINGDKRTKLENGTFFMQGAVERVTSDVMNLIKK